MNKKLTNSIEKNIITRWYLTKNSNNQNKFENNFTYDENVLLFCAPNIIKDDHYSIYSHLLPLMTAINSLLYNTKNKAHIFFTEEQNEEFNFYNNLFAYFYKNDKSKRIKLEIISNNNLSKISNFKKTQRAKRWGQLNSFANLTFYILNSKLYKNTILFHNDVIFHKWSDEFIMKNELEECDFTTLFGPIYFKEDEIEKFNKLMNADISSWIEFDKESFLKQHIHTGILAVSEEFTKVFSKFFQRNYEKWIKEEKEYKYIEQEIIAIFIYSKEFSEKNLLSKRVGKMEGKYSFNKQNLKLNSKYIHYDFNQKALNFIKEAKSYNSLPYGLKILYNETKKIHKLLK